MYIYHCLFFSLTARSSQGFNLVILQVLPVSDGYLLDRWRRIGFGPDGPIVALAQSCDGKNDIFSLMIKWYSVFGW